VRIGRLEIGMRRVARVRVVAGFGSIAVGLGGCATLSRGLDDEVAVISEPPGAAVTSSAGARCAATPCTLTVSRDAVFTVTVSKPGYASQTVDVTTRVSGTGAALATENVATAGLGLAVDAATGGALEHVPNPVSVTLAALAGPVPKPIHGRAKP
jgi:hypothetical protein